MQKKLRLSAHADAVLKLSQRPADTPKRVETNTLAHRALPGAEGE